MSWDDEFAERYEEWSAEMTEDVPFYVSLAREADGPLVQLAVGSLGRVAIPVAEATGKPVLGIDFSPAMLEQARARAAAAGIELDLRLGDMRDLELDEPAALIYCPFRALLHLADVAGPAPHVRTRSCLTATRRPLRVERLCSGPQDRHQARRRAPRRAGSAHSALCSRRQPRRHRPRRRRLELALVGDQERVARAARRQRSRARGPLRRLRPYSGERRQPRVRVRRASAHRLAVSLEGELRVHCTTAASTSSSRTTHEIRIGDVEMIAMLMPAAASASNMSAATPGSDFMPAPTSETFPCGGPWTRLPPRSSWATPATPARRGRGRSRQRERDVGVTCLGDVLHDHVDVDPRRRRAAGRAPRRSPDGRGRRRSHLRLRRVVRDARDDGAFEHVLLLDDPGAVAVVERRPT